MRLSPLPLVIVTAAACGRIGFAPEQPADGPRSDDSHLGDGLICQSPAPVFVQTQCNSQPAVAASLTATFAAQPAVGHLLVVAADFANTTSKPSVSDSVGNVFTPIGAVLRGATISTQVWYAVNVASGSDAVTVTLDIATNNLALYIHEYRLPMPAVDSSTMGGGTSQMFSPPTAITMHENDLLFAFGVISGVTVTSIDSAFTVRGRCNGNLAADSIAPVSGPYVATFTASASNDWLATLLAFKSLACP
ncbi:MAG: hypothetical protein JWO36_1882 [Myxococcales bacterium]|nr:hypothetical protein [Myxococcales bacterium]